MIAFLQQKSTQQCAEGVQNSIRLWKIDLIVVYRTFHLEQQNIPSSQQHVESSSRLTILSAIKQASLNIYKKFEYSPVSSQTPMN